MQNALRKKERGGGGENSNRTGEFEQSLQNTGTMAVGVKKLSVSSKQRAPADTHSLLSTHSLHCMN